MLQVEGAPVPRPRGRSKLGVFEEQLRSLEAGLAAAQLGVGAEVRSCRALLEGVFREVGSGSWAGQGSG